jgi:hypothetical protein
LVERSGGGIKEDILPIDAPVVDVVIAAIFEFR